ncbi:MAG: hypothetical protein Q9227_002346 [Pyrenula ochraceoflavens]
MYVCMVSDILRSIVFGSVNGALKDAFNRLTKIQAKSSLSFAIFLGDFFGEETSDAHNEELMALIKGDIAIPLPSYFTVGSRSLPSQVIEKLERDDDQLCPNLSFLGRRTTYTTSEGVRIVNLGGKYADPGLHMANGQARFIPSFTEIDARALHGANSCDILITSEWPQSVINGSRTAGAELEAHSIPPSQACLSVLSSKLRPRYHVTTSPSIFFEREPFFHAPTESNPDTRPITRFLSLGSYKNSAGARFTYAFSLDPSEPLPLASAPLSPDTTASPFAASQKRSGSLNDQQQSYQRFNGNASKYEQNSDHKRRRRRDHRPAPLGPEECFFCLSNPSIRTHLITSIGEHAYLTISRGPLPTMTTFPSFNGKFPGHMLIIPLAHSSTITNPNDRASTFSEMSRYRKAMTAMLHRLGKPTTPTTSSSPPPDDQTPLGSVCWDLSRSGVRHFAWQWMPVPGPYVTKGLVDGAFRVKAESVNYPPFEPIEPNAEVPLEKGDYFRVWIASPPTSSSSSHTDNTKTSDLAANVSESSLLMQIPPEQNFNIQFGREVMASLLKLERRMDWKQVLQPEEEEEAAAKAFKEAFKEFNFALD